MTEWVLEDFGGHGERGFKRYREYVEGVDPKEMKNPLRKIIASTYLGSEEFIKRISGEHLEKRRIDKRNVPAIKAILRGPSLKKIEEAVVKAVGKDHDLFRKLCVHLSHQHTGLSLNEIGAYFGMTGSAVSQLSKRFRETIKGDNVSRGTLTIANRETNATSAHNSNQCLWAFWDSGMLHYLYCFL